MAGGPPMTFSMPMMRDFVPQKLRPWIYVVFAFCFQLSGGMYLGALNEIVSGKQYMLEDVLMCLYCNLAGMAIYFPILFRMKFRFTNKTLLMGAALGMAACQLGAAYAPNLPTLWLFCLVAGFCKIQGTFECMSNIQLWITPPRDFRVFFPVLHIFILGSMQVSDYVAAHVANAYGWQSMHWLMSAIFLTVALVLMLITRRVHIMPPVSFRGIDWLGAALWLAWLLQVAFFFNYGSTYDWLHSKTLRAVGMASILTLAAAVARSFLVAQPYISPGIWKVKNFFLVIVVTTLAEAFLATEHVLEEIFYEEGMKYTDLMGAQLDAWSLLGVVLGCAFSYVWMKKLGLSYLRLTTIGFLTLAAYLIIFYTTVQPGLNIEAFRLPLVLRSFAYAALSISLMTMLHDMMTFETFFQALSLFNMTHMIIGGVLGAAVYTQGFKFYIQDNLVRYAESFDHIAVSRSPIGFAERMEAILHNIEVMSIKQLYGWVAYACIAVGLTLLLYKVPLVRVGFKKMKNWKDVGRKLRRKVRRAEGSAARRLPV